MTARGAAMLGSIVFILLLALASYLLDVPPGVVTIATCFAVGVVLWVGTRTRGGPGSTSHGAERPKEEKEEKEEKERV